MEEMNAIKIYYAQILYGSNFNLTDEFSLCLREENPENHIVSTKFCVMTIEAQSVSK